MSRVIPIILFALFSINCQTTSVDDVQAEHEKEAVSTNAVNQPTTNCQENNQTEACSLTLETIRYEIPDLSCEPYQLVVEVETSFYTPAGLGDGSLSRIDWEFLPQGNAGFWVSNIEQPIAPNTTGSISMSGCFTYGDQSTLRITRTIIDQLGNESNALVIEVDNPNNSKVMVGAESAFLFSTTELQMN